ncbi:MAG TPA: hypothetical protein VFV38_45630 [Ktedonobacteraceae bacterium]|nr:hypothetical protein [Ktedonobacteraceae bacterium]
MRCPRCSFEGELVEGACAQCGYQRVSDSQNLRNGSASDSRSLSLPVQAPPGPSRSLSLPLHAPSGPLRAPSMPLRAPSGPLHAPSLPLHAPSGPLRVPSMSLQITSTSSRPLSLYTAKSGDLLHQGRYRLVDQLLLPDNQQGQGAAWLAVDTTAGVAQVVLREVVLPAGDPTNKAQAVRTLAMHLSEACQHPGFPKVLDVFNEQASYFIVLQHIEGESLASLLRRQGGALPERTVAEYGRQLCEMLAVLARQSSPIAHGAISPETVIISPDRHRVHIIHLPLFPPKEAVNAVSSASYKAPEQARGVVDPASDLYSVAATMHHAVTGFDPRERIAFFYPPARRLNPTVSPQMETILAQELRLSAPQRYARAVDMQSDLETLLATRPAEPERRALAVASDSLKLDLIQMRQRSRSRNLAQLSIFSIVCLVVLLGIIVWYMYPSLKVPTTAGVPTPNATATMTALYNQELSQELQVYQKEHVGLSDGLFAFDTFSGHSAAEITNKQRAAKALQSGDVSTAQNLYEQATSYDPTDGEAQIYAEDIRIKQSGAPYITIVLGLPLNNQEANLSYTRPDLQAAYEFQHNTNTHNLLPGGLKLRVLIANTGDAANDTNLVGKVAQFVANRVKNGNPDHIVAAVGWPSTDATSVAVPAFTAAQIPLVAQTASGVRLNGISPYFFRVNPTDDSQGQALGKFAAGDGIGAQKVLVLHDPSDPYSQSLASAFATSFQQQGGTVYQDQVTMSGTTGSGQPATVAQFQAGPAQDAINKRVDLIFIAGYDQDAVRMAHALGNISRMFPGSAYLASLKVLSGDAADTGLVLGQGTGADSAIAQQFPRDMRRLSFTSFSDIAEWNGKSKPAFFSAWDKLYKQMNNPAPSVTNDAVMTHDAFGVILDALNLVKGPLTGAKVRTALASIGTGGNPVYSGVSGQIHFGSDGNPINKAVVVLTVVADATGTANMVQYLSIAGQF